MHRTRSLLAMPVVVVVAAVAAHATDIPIVGRKLIVVDRTNSAGTAKAVFLAKDPAITKGSGTDPARIQATLDIAYDAIRGTFDMPQGGNWLVNSASVGKYVNLTAPTGGATKRGLLEQGSLVKVVGKSLGDAPLDISTPPSGAVYAVDTVLNSGETIRLCTQFSGCVHKSIARKTGYKLICKGNSTGDAACTGAVPLSTTSTSTSTTSSTTTSTLASCTCGDGICQAEEPLSLCADDCRIAHAVTLPIVFGDCLFADYVNSEDCSQLSSSFSALENTCHTGATSSQAIAVLPTECGGQGAVAALSVGDFVPVLNGQSTILIALRDCWDHGIRDFVAPIVSCNAACNVSVAVVGFAPIRLTSRPVATGSPKGFTWSSFCSADGPCGLGMCASASGDCSTCPEDCGGCTACP